MQMTKAAAVAILAFTSSALAYYPGSGYSDGLYAREAYPEAYPEAEFDFEDIYARDAEPEFDIHPRDAYMEGYQAGLYARAPPARGAQTQGQGQGQFSLKNFQTDVQQQGEYKQDVASQQKAFDKERKEMEAAQKKLKGAERQYGQNEKELAQDRKQFGAMRNQANENSKKQPGQHSQMPKIGIFELSSLEFSRANDCPIGSSQRESFAQKGRVNARDLYDYYGYDY